MKKVIYIILFGLSIVGCTTNKYLPKKYKIGEVEYFDMEFFEKNKNRFNQVSITKDSIKIHQTHNEEWYGDYITLYKKNYSIIKRFYPNGTIMERGKTYYPGGFKIGIWEYFDDAGNLVKTEDMDKRYKVSYKKALRKVFWRYGFLKKNLKIEMSSGDWILTNIKGCQRGKSASVNRETGEVKRVKIKVIHMNYTGKDIEDYMEEARRKNFENKPDSTVVNQK